MRRLVLSDLYLEMVKPRYSWRLPETAAELVVLAGGISVGIDGFKWATRESERPWGRGCCWLANGCRAAHNARLSKHSCHPWRSHIG
jgi:hypothetical protein